MQERVKGGGGGEKEGRRKPEYALLNGPFALL